MGGDSINKNQIIKAFFLIAIFANIFYVPFVNTVKVHQISEGILSNVVAIAEEEEEEVDSEHFNEELEEDQEEDRDEDVKIESELFSEMGSVAVVLGFATVSIYILRIINKIFFENKNSFLINSRKYMKSLHPFMGVLLIVVSGIHGYSLLVEDGALLGLAAWIALVIIILSTYGKVSKIKIWLYIHKIFTVLFFLLLFCHLSD